MLLVSPPSVGRTKAQIVKDAVGDGCSFWETTHRSLGLHCFGVRCIFSLQRLEPRENGPPARNPEIHSPDAARSSKVPLVTAGLWLEVCGDDAILGSLSLDFLLVFFFHLFSFFIRMKR